jgi:hypothetical protein
MGWEKTRWATGKINSGRSEAPQTFSSDGNINYRTKSSEDHNALANLDNMPDFDEIGTPVSQSPSMIIIRNGVKGGFGLDVKCLSFTRRVVDSKRIVPPS